ncbi:hypothetical protein [Pseudomonas sp. R5(2019)]|nr:hypothetical protein [Pseudomonas sp. R5(2019)]NBA97047.1 hypothetical protein [Pseudomonas sp. R5(2019)]
MSIKTFVTSTVLALAAAGMFAGVVTQAQADRQVSQVGSATELLDRQA